MNVDREVLAGFTEEVKGYLPRILDALEAYRKDPGRHGDLTEAYRLTHSIRGAAAMVGMARLSHIASLAEECLDEVAAGRRELNAQAAETLAGTIEAIDTYLDRCQDPGFDPEEIVLEVAEAFRGLPLPGDAAPAPLFAGAGADSPVSLDDIPPDLLETFQQEMVEHLGQVSGLLAELSDHPESREVLQLIRRSVHTVKGSSALVGFAPLSRLAHRMEDLLDLLYEERQALTPETLRLLLQTADAMEDLLAAPRELPEDRRRAELYARYDELLEGPAAAAGGGSPAAVPSHPGETGEAALLPARAARAAGAAGGSTVRVPIERLDELVRLVSELVVHRTVFERHLEGLARQVADLGRSGSRLRQLAGRLEIEALVPAGVESALARVPNPLGSAGGFDALELDRYGQIHLLARDLTETGADLGAVGGELKTSAGDLDAWLLRLGRLTSTVQGRLMRLRMVPLGGLSSRLSRAVRTAAETAGKQVDFVFEGQEVELDKTVLEAIADPLVHLLRNAVAHGIEPPAERLAGGKPGRGRIRLSAANEGVQIVLQIQDDGAGMDREKLRRSAVRQGLLGEDDAAALAGPELMALAFLPGLSTAGGVSEISGRGVGLDVVKAAVSQLKGTVTAETRPGLETVFTIRLPVTLALAKVLMVKAHGETFALPLAVIAQILRIDRGDIEQIGREPVLRLSGSVYPLVVLGEALALRRGADEVVQHPPVVVLHLGDREVALLVDEIAGAREVVVKTLGPLLRHVRGVAGATLTGDGRVVLILNPGELGAAPSSSPVGFPAAERAAAVSPDILVVDDSLSARRVLCTVMSAAGWRPIPARDGVDALEILQSLPRRPAAILLDLEMPRMDGYELLAMLRGQEAYRTTPIVVLTSRAGEKHQQRAFELGATEYLVKPFQEDALKAVVGRVLAEAGRRGA